MSVIDDVRATLGLVRNEWYHCWDCDANFREAVDVERCVYCGSPDVRAC